MVDGFFLAVHLLAEVSARLPGYMLANYVSAMKYLRHTKTPHNTTETHGNVRIEKRGNVEVRGGGRESVSTMERKTPSPLWHGPYSLGPGSVATGSELPAEASPAADAEADIEAVEVFPLEHSLRSG